MERGEYEGMEGETRKEWGRIMEGEARQEWRDENMKEWKERSQ
jgi:hypothetical protein